MIVAMLVGALVSAWWLGRCLVRAGEAIAAGHIAAARKLAESAATPVMPDLSGLLGAFMSSPETGTTLER